MTTTSTHALRGDVMPAPEVLKVPMNRAACQAYVNQLLLPMLRLEDVIIKVNRPDDKGSEVRLSVEAAGATRAIDVLIAGLPLDREPFSKLKIYVRKAAEASIDQVWTLTREPIDIFTRQNCIN